MDQNQAASFGIEKLYVKDLSIEVPNAPAIFLEREAPQVDIQLNTKAAHLGDGAFDVMLTVTVTAKLGDKAIFLVEAVQAGVFRIVNVPEDQVEPLLAVACPNILFPYAREVVSDAVIRAGFAPVLLQPVNFEGLYLAKLQEQEAVVDHETLLQ
jgi:preprotein translocase subunit SecB